jgi:hypothetical protein
MGRVFSSDVQRTSASSPAGDHRLPPPRLIDEHPQSFIVRDATGMALGYFHFEDEPSRRTVTKRLTRGEAKRMAITFARLPQLLRRKD